MAQRHHLRQALFLWLNASMSNERAPQTQDKFIVRLPDGMRDRIRAAAEANNRSMNAEIVARLEATLETGAGQPQTVSPDMRAAMQAIFRSVNEATAVYRTPEFIEAVRAFSKRAAAAKAESEDEDSSSEPPR